MRTLLLIGSPVSLYQRFTYDMFWKISGLIKGDLYYFSSNKYIRHNLPPSNINLIENKAYAEAKTWEVKKLVLDTLYDKYKFDRIVIFKNAFLPQVKLGQEKKVENYYKELQGDYSFNFISPLNKYNYALPIMYFTVKYKLPVIQLIHDPMEFDWSKVFNTECKRYFFYEDKQLNAKFLPYIEYSQFCNFTDFEIEKFTNELDLVFGCTVMEERRRQVVNEILNLLDGFKKEYNIELYIKDKFKEQNETLTQHKYYKKLQTSKYTFITSSYEDEYFYWIKFCEALTRFCIPLIYYKCKFNNIFVNYPDLYDIIINNKLIIENKLQLKKVLEDKIHYQKVLNDFYQSKSLLKLMNKNYYNQYKI